MITTLSQGTLRMGSDHGGNSQARTGFGDGEALGKCPDCAATFYKPPDPTAPGALLCKGCGHDFVMGAIARFTR